MILAICNSGQYEIAAYSAVKEFIEGKGIEIVSFCQDKCLKNEYLSFRSENNFQGFIITIDGKEYNADEFRSIWYMKPQLPLKLITSQPHEYAHFMQKQFFTVRKGLWLQFRERNWLNDPVNMETVENKLFQQYKAREVGFNLPRTLVSSNPKEIRSFYKRNQRTIVKSLSPTIIPDYVVFTNEVKEEHLKDLNSAKFAPAIYQELVYKLYELRITIVGLDIFAAKIYSQEDLATSLDWRVQPKLNDYSVRMEETKLPEDLEMRIRNYMSLLGLRFGCIDMIVTPENKYVFLEINPNGQWYFVQLSTGMEIAKSIARILCQPY